jgi:hypothetical protein
VLTIFSIPKSFRGPVETIQINAIRSWLRLGSGCEVILFGDDEGTAEIAREYGIYHVPDVKRNEYGTPLLSSVFEIAQRIAKNRLMCYINADIILFSDLLPAVSRVKREQFMLTGQRWDVDIPGFIEFDNPRWELDLKALVTRCGKLHAPTGMDYFVFPSGLYRDIPPLAIGRGGWDNWLVYRARASKVPVIDATGAITAIHQNHDYSHYADGKKSIWDSPERKKNTELMGGMDKAFSLEYATHLLTPQGTKSAFSARHLYFQLRAIPVLHPTFHFLLWCFRFFEKCLYAVRPPLGKRFHQKL